MTNWDIEYLKLCKETLKNGVEVENRTGVNTIKIPSYNLTFDLSKEFPILTTKQLFYKHAIKEMLWFWQMQSNNVKDLHNIGVHIWDEWMIDDDGIYRIYEPYGEYDPEREVEVIDPLSVPIDDPFGLTHKFKVKRDEKGNVLKAKGIIEGKTIKAAKWYGKEYAGTIGTAYGFLIKRYKHTQNLIQAIEMCKTGQNDRRIVKSLWQDEFLRTAVLPSCVWSTEWDVTGDTLNLIIHQRSCDIPLGLPFNVIQYAVFLAMIAQVTGLKPGKISYSIKDAHIYVNQVEGIITQINREKRYNQLKKLKEELLRLNAAEPTESDMKEILRQAYGLSSEDELILDVLLNPEKPELWLNPEIEDFFDFDNSKDLKDVKIKNYKHMGKITFPIAQ